MPWYKAGTVSAVLNSSTVTGANTQFAANTRVGDAFRGPDGRWYEIVNVASDTVISISPAYQGATANGGSYALAPMQGYVKDSADALRALVNQFGSKLAALGTTGNYDILPVAKGGLGRTDGRALLAEVGVQQAAALYSTQGMYMGWNSGSQGEGHFVVNRGNGIGGYSFRSVNAGNTATGPAMTYSYEGLLTVPQVSVTGAPIAVSSGGTGGNTQASARAGLGLGTAAVAALVGTVTQGGAAVMESGSNSNGWFIKFADGTMICRGVVNASPAISNQSGNLYYYVGSLAFAASFVGIAPQVFPFFNADGYLTWVTVKGTPGLSAFNYYVMANTPTGVTGILGFMAIGRWF